MQLGNQTLGKLGLFNVADESKLRPVGGTLMKAPKSMSLTSGDASGQIESGYLEKSNVDPAVEMTKLMEAQRLLEANANMIRYQDQSLGRLVNDLGKI
jgi:flagellar basal-body rod protein FlgG